MSDDRNDIPGYGPAASQPADGYADTRPLDAGTPAPAAPEPTGYRPPAAPEPQAYFPAAASTSPYPAAPGYAPAGAVSQPAYDAGSSDTVVYPGPSGNAGGRAWSGGAVIAAAVAGSLIGGVLMAAAMLLLFGLPAVKANAPKADTASPASQTKPVATRTRSTATSASPGTVQAVAALVTPSVVNVAIEEQMTNHFTGATSSQVVGNGSGVIIRSDGYIMTNYHVVNGASRILIKIGLDDVPAKVVGVDAGSDIAVVKVEKTGLPAATIGDSGNLAVGQEVVAIGSPFGLDKTVTSGIISALNRTGEAADQTQQTFYYNLIQTDAAINPGNSGGALADLEGNVIGINTLIQTGGAQQSAGIGFAIPIRLAKQVADELITSGKATHTFLGVAAVDVNAMNAQQLGVKTTTGALVQEVQADTPAAKAGILRGDVILKIGDAPVEDSQHMVAAVRSHKPGDTVDILVEREGKQQTMKAVLGSTSQ